MVKHPANADVPEIMFKQDMKIGLLKDGTITESLRICMNCN